MYFTVEEAKEYISSSEYRVWRVAGFKNACREIIRLNEVIEELEKEIARLREQVRWIPVGERLPEEEDYYLTMKKEITGWAYKTAWFHKGIKMFEKDEYWFMPTHWMPLPQPPEE